MKNKKGLFIIGIILLIIIFFIPVKSDEFIKYAHPWEDGGPVYNGYYNIFNIKIFEKPKYN